MGMPEPPACSSECVALLKNCSHSAYLWNSSPSRNNPTHRGARSGGAWMVSVNTVMALNPDGAVWALNRWIILSHWLRSAKWRQPCEVIRSYSPAKSNAVISAMRVSITRPWRFARVFSFVIPASEMSSAVTSKPARARGMAFRPSPQPRSSTLALRGVQE